jgi:mono/diheme cytochrome c family protein
VIQAMLTLNLHQVPGAEALITTLSSTASARGVKEIGTQILQGGRSQGQRPSLADTGAGAVNMSVDDRRMLLRGEGTYKELCYSCHGPDGKGAPMQGAPAGTLLAPALAGADRVVGHPDFVIKVLLHGLTGEIDGKTYGTGVMVPMGSNTDQWIADVASYVRNSFGNSARMITPEQVAAVRKSTRRSQPWTMVELEPTIPKPLANTAEWKATASVNAEAAVNATDATPTNRWDTGAAQQPGVWFQVELPQPTRITEIHLQSAAPAAGRGGRGRGAGPPAAGPVAYTVQVSADGTSWGAPVAQGSGETPTTVITFAPVTAKFVRITQTGTARNGEQWAIQQVEVLEAGK